MRWHTALVVAVVALVYANALRAAFVWDDLYLVVGNAAIKQLANVPRLFWSDLFPVGIDSGYYRPLQALTYAVDYALWGLNPAGFHSTNVVLHAATAVLLYRVGVRVLGSARAALASALLFAVHPLHVEAVAYVAGRSDPLAALCMLVAVLGFLRGDRRGHMLSVAMYFVALLAREAAFVLPLLLMVLDRVPPRSSRRSIRQYVPYAGALGLYLVLRSLVPTPIPVAIIAPAPLGFRLLTMADVIVRYLALVVAPIGLHMERVVSPVTSVVEPRALAGLAVIGMIVIVSIRARSTRAWPLALGGAWFLVALLPVANLVPLATFMAEHWLYVPLMGLCLAVGWSVDAIRPRAWRRAMTIGLAVVLAVYGGLTMRQSARWSDGRTLYEYLLPLAPESARVRVNLAQVYQEAGELEPARVLYLDVVRLRPNDAATAEALNNLGNIERAGGAAAAALAHFERALELKPRHVAARNGRALALQDLGRVDEAEAELHAALALDAAAATTRSNLGNLYFRRGDLTRAREQYLAAVRLDPEHADAHNNLGSVYFRLGDHAGAEAEYRMALRLNPASEGARRNLAIVLGD
jgi:protein O-mannosyl-transferase